MLIDKNGVVIESPEYNSYERNGTTYYYRGLMYIPGKKAGIESVKAVADTFEKSGGIPFSSLRGSFSYIIRSTDRTYAFADNSKQNCLFISRNAVSSSYTQLLDYEKSYNGEVLSFDIESITEYYTLGRIFFGKTHFKQVKMLDSEKYVVIEAGGIKILDKGIGGIDSEGEATDPRRFWNEFGLALSEDTTCQALTGGYDSRMVCTCLNNRIDIHPTICSNRGNNPEVVVSMKVAELLKCKLNIIKTPKPDVTEDFIRKQIACHDGIVPNSLDSNFVMFNLKSELHKQGYNVIVTGDGGVLHKDWEWMQDLPFYHRKKTNLRKFYYQRLAFDYRNDHIGKLLKKADAQQEERVIGELKQYLKETNTQSYDNLYFSVSGNRNVYYTPLVNDVCGYAPLNELDLVRYSYRLPRRKRFFYGYMRNVICAENREVARIPTIYGTTASDEAWFIIRDVSFQLIQYFVKACRMISRRFFKYSPFDSSIEDWSLEEEIRSLDMAKKSTIYAVEHQVLETGTSIKDLNYNHLLRIMHIYYLGEKYDTKWK